MISKAKYGIFYKGSYIYQNKIIEKIFVRLGLIYKLKPKNESQKSIVMKKSILTRIAVFLNIVVFVSSNIFSQTVTIDGFAFLENQTDHSGIKVLFIPNSPSAQLDSTYTNQDGDYTISIEPGVYFVSFHKSGYQTYIYGDAVVFGEDETLEDVMLIPGNFVYISGNINGTLTADNIYIVESDISIIYGDVLIIEPGTTIKFGLDCNLYVFGLLYAEGIDNENILFTSAENNPNTNDWGKIQFNNDSSIFKYCKVEYGYEIQLSTDENESLIIENCDISYMYNAISCGQSGVIVRNNIIHHFNHTGIEIWSANIHIQNNSIILNLFEGADLKGILSWDLNNLIIDNNLIFSPVVINGPYSCGIWIPDVESCEIYNNIISNMNTGIYLGSNGSIKVVNNTIVNNFGIGVNVYEPESATLLQSNIIAGSAIGIKTYYENGFLDISFNNLWDNIENFNSNIPGIGEIITTNSNGNPCDTYYNISLDPLFVDYNSFDYHISEGSPVIDAGNNMNVVSEIDLDNNIRIWDGNNNGIAIVDMGAYEFGSNAIITSISTLNNNEENNVFTIYPNPIEDVLNIDFDEIQEKPLIELFLITGQIVYSKQLNYLSKNLKINVSFLEKGIYVGIIKANNKNYYFKILK